MFVFSSPAGAAITIMIIMMFFVVDDELLLLLAGNCLFIQRQLSHLDAGPPFSEEIGISRSFYSPVVVSFAKTAEIMPRRALLIFAAFLGVVWCFHASERKCTTSGSRTCSMKSESFAQNKIAPVIVTNNEPRSKDFLKYAASELNLNLKYVNIEEFDHSKLSDNSITIINAGVGESNKLDSLKLVGYVKI